jgi:hypothetical protein
MVSRTLEEERAIGSYNLIETLGRAQSRGASPNHKDINITGVGQFWLGFTGATWLTFP